MFDNILARLGIAGTIKKADSPEAAGANKIVTTDYTGKISPTLVSAGTVDSVAADHVTYTVGSLPDTANLQTLLVAMHAEYIHKDSKLGDIPQGDRADSFDAIKQVAGIGTTAGDWPKAGVVFRAAYDTLTDTYTTTDGTVPYAVTPAVANTRYLIKNAGTSGSPADPGAQMVYGYIGYTTALSAGLGTSTAANDRTFVSREYVTSAIAVGLGVTTTGTVWVSPTGTNTSTTNIFSFTAPYGSVRQAQDALATYRGINNLTTTPMTIVVLPGVYTVNNSTNEIGASYLRIHFMPGAITTYGSANLWTAGLFKLTNLTDFSVTGYGEFILSNDSPDSGILYCGGSGITTTANIYFECQSMTTAYGRAINLHNYNAASALLKIKIKVHGDITNAHGSRAAIYLGGHVDSNIQIEGNLYSLAGGIDFGSNSPAQGLTTATHLIKSNAINCVGTAINFYNCSSAATTEATTILANIIKSSGSGASTITTTDTGSSYDGKLNVVAEKIYSADGNCLDVYNGFVSVSNATLQTAAAKHCVYLSKLGVDYVTLRGLYLINASGLTVGAGVTNSKIRLIGTTYAVAGKMDEVSFTGGFFDVKTT